MSKIEIFTYVFGVATGLVIAALIRRLTHE